MQTFFELRNITVTADTLRMWLDALSDLSLEELTTAVRRFNRECTEYPSPAALRSYSGVAGATDQDRATIAWAVVRQAIRSVGGYESVDFDDPIVNAAIRALGGWEQVCLIETEELPFLEQRFRKAYGSIANTGLGDGSQLAGIAERENTGLSGVEVQVRRIETGLRPHANARRLMGVPNREVPRQQVLIKSVAKALTVRDE